MPDPQVTEPDDVVRDLAQLSRQQPEAFQTIPGNDFRPFQKRNGRTSCSSVGHVDRDC